MANIAGYNGQVDFGTIIDSDVCGYSTFSWSLDQTADTLDSTDFCSTGWRDFIAGLKTWSGSVELYIDGTSRIQPSDVGTSAAIHLYMNSTNYLSGTAICTGWNPTVAVDGIESQTISFQGTGALTAV